MNKKILIILGITILVILTGSFWFLQKDDMQENAVIPVETGIQENNNDIDVVMNDADEEKKEESQIVYNEDGTIDTSNWKIYKNERYEFEVRYPEEYIVHSDYLYTSDSKSISFFKKDNTKDPVISIEYGNECLNESFATSKSVTEFIGKHVDIQQSKKKYNLKNNIIAYEIKLGGHYDVSALLIIYEKRLINILINPTSGGNLGDLEFAIINSFKFVK